VPFFLSPHIAKLTENPAIRDKLLATVLLTVVPGSAGTIERVLHFKQQYGQIVTAEEVMDYVLADGGKMFHCFVPERVMTQAI